VKKKHKKTVSVIITVLLIFSTLICFFIIIQSAIKREVSLFGCRFYYVTTGSMDPTIPPGSIIIVRKPEAAYKTGDIISYVSRDKSIYGKVNTHRIVEIIQDDGQSSYITKGDANSAADELAVPLSDVIGRVIWSSGYIPVIGWLLDFLGTRLGFLMIILLPVLLITAASIRDFTKEYKNELNRVKEEMYQKQLEESKAEDTDK
jgi:signal peptidase